MIKELETNRLILRRFALSDVQRMSEINSCEEVMRFFPKIYTFEDTLKFIKSVMKNYENNDLQIVGDHIFINGVKTNSYTFKQDYFYLIGDNRHNSLDARYWGYVPFDHVLGKPVMVWFSWDANAPSLGAKLKSIRWDRMFTTVHGEGKPTSYRYFVLLFVLLYIGYNFYKGKKKSEKK